MTVVGCLIVIFAGLLMGSGAWPFKLLRKYKYEHWMFVGMGAGLVIIPWSLIYINCPNILNIYASLWATHKSDFVRSNMLAVGWGIANVTSSLCFTRIGVGLTGAIITGVGATVGVLTPLLLKSSGMGSFGSAPNLLSPAGIWIIAGIIAMLTGVVFAALAGFGRDKMLNKATSQYEGNFTTGLTMAAVAGALSAGLPLAFVYSNGPVVDAMKSSGASEFISSLAVWPIGALGGVMVNILFPMYLLFKNRSWSVLTSSKQEFVLAAMIGVNMIISMSLQGYGMRMIGALGAAVGIGLQQASQIMGGQILGFISGEWRGVFGKPIHRMYAAIGLLIIAAVIMTYGNHV